MKNLKTANLKWISAVLVGDILICAILLGGVSLYVLAQLSVAAAVPVLALLMASLIPSGAKAVLVTGGYTTPCRGIGHLVITPCAIRESTLTSYANTWAPFRQPSRTRILFGVTYIAKCRTNRPFPAPSSSFCFSETSPPCRNWGAWLASEAFEYLIGDPAVTGNVRLSAALWKRPAAGGFEGAVHELERDPGSHSQVYARDLRSAVSRMASVTRDSLSRSSIQVHVAR